jgi:hypothetical protein
MLSERKRQHRDTGRRSVEREPLTALRRLPHVGVLLGCYALLINLAFAALPVPAWLAPAEAITVDAQDGWSLNPLASLCRYGAQSTPDGDAPPANSLACSKCCCPAVALASADGPLADPLRLPERKSDLASDALGYGLIEAWAFLIRAPPVNS